MLDVRRLSGTLGAEIHGVNLASSLSRQTVAEIRRAFLDHRVIFFRAQDLTPAQFLAFARTLGQPVEYPFVKGLADTPQIIQVTKLEHEHTNFGGIWHSDTAYLEQPPMGSMLLAREVPPAGGDTLFADQYLAYEALSAGMRKLLDGLVSVNSSAKADVTRTREDRMKTEGREDAKAEYVAEHPVVRTHPETGRKGIYVNAAFTQHIVGMERGESDALLKHLYAQAAIPEYQCRFRWGVNSIAFWDNRASQHYAASDYWPAVRRMERVTVAGDKPR